MRQRIIILSIIFFLALFLPETISACSCRDPRRYYENTIKQPVIYRISVNDAKYSLQEIGDADAAYKAVEIVSDIGYSIVDNISGSNLPKDVLIKQIDRRKLKWDLYCDCEDYTRRIFNNHVVLKPYYEYVVFLDHDPEVPYLTVLAAVEVSDDHVFQDFKPLGVWKNYPELKSEISRQDENIYTWKVPLLTFQQIVPSLQTAHRMLFASIILASVFSLVYMITRKLRKKPTVTSPV